MIFIAHFIRGTIRRQQECYIGNDEFCIKNDELCIKNDEICIKYDEMMAGTTVLDSPVRR